MMFKALAVLAVSVCSVLCQEDRPVPVVNMAANKGLSNEGADFQSFLDDGTQNGFGNEHDQFNSDTNQPQPILMQGFVAGNVEMQGARWPGNNNNNGNNNGNNLACGFSCSRRTAFNVNIDGTFSSVTCSDGNADVKSRCDGCCVSRGLTAGITEDWSSGFISNNGECICCHMNHQCGGFPIPAVAANPFGNK